MLYKNLIKEKIKSLFDSLNRFLIILLIIFLILSFFIRNFYIDITKYILLILIIFRLTSKNRIKRNKENKTYLKIRNFIFHPFSNLLRNFKDRKKFVYKKCFKCKTTLKLPLPKSRGINHAKCPNCGKRVTLFTLRKKPKEKIKVEIIKKKR